MRAFPLIPPLAILLLAACEPPVPEDATRGAGFETPEQYIARREAQLGGQRPLGPSAPSSEAERLAQETRAILGIPGVAAAPAPDLDRDNPQLSREQDFAAVSAERDIQADADRLRAARQQRQEVQPVALERPADAGPNIVAYALNEAQPVGNATFGRGIFASDRKAQTACAGYRDDNAAQEAFLAGGGPRRDGLGLDPDGDGNACGWDPAVYRSLVRSQ